MKKKDQRFAAIAAFGIVELGVQLPYDEFLKLCAKDDLWIALVERFEAKQEREDRRTALLCHVINRSAGGKMDISDFMPKKASTTQNEIANGLKSQIMAYHLARTSKKKAGS